MPDNLPPEPYVSRSLFAILTSPSRGLFPVTRHESLEARDKYAAGLILLTHSLQDLSIANVLDSDVEAKMIAVFDGTSNNVFGHNKTEYFILKSPLINPSEL